MGWNTYTPALEAGITSPYSHLKQVVASRQDVLKRYPLVLGTGVPLFGRVAHRARSFDLVSTNNRRFESGLCVQE